MIAWIAVDHPVAQSISERPEPVLERGAEAIVVVAVLASQTTGATAQRAKQQSATRRTALQKDISSLRSREQSMRVTLAKADAYNTNQGE